MLCYRSRLWADEVIEEKARILDAYIHFANDVQLIKGATVRKYTEVQRYHGKKQVKYSDRSHLKYIIYSD